MVASSQVACVCMFHRFSTWWRALSVAVLGFATITWPSVATAGPTPSFAVVFQDSVANLSASGAAGFSVDLAVPHGTVDNVTLALYPPVVARSEVSAVTDGTGATAAPLASTSASSPSCRTGSSLSLNVSLFSARGVGASQHCGSQPLHLRLPCQTTACDGVYPLSIAVSVDHVRHVEWSLLAVHATSVLVPLRVDFIPVVDPTAWAAQSVAQANFKVLSHFATIPLTLAVDYRPLSRALLSPSSRAWRDALASALASPEHRAIVAPPSSVDFAGLSTNGFSSEVSRQIALAGQFLRSLTGRYPDGPLFVAAPTSDAALVALASAGVSDVVLPDTSLSVPPSTTLTWGAPFHLPAAATITGLATDSGLEQLAANAAIEPGRRAALTLATLAFLHFEAPNAPAVRTVVLPLNVGAVSPTYLADLLGASSSNPFVSPATLAPSFDASLIGSNTSPAEQILSPAAASVWSTNNVATLKELISRTGSYLQAIGSPTQSVALETYLALSEQLGSPPSRQSALAAAAAYLNKQLGDFRIDESAVTLTGSRSELPITIFSSARYPVTLVLHLITDRLNFAKGDTYAVTLSAPTTSLRITTTDRRGGSLTLQLELTTPDGNLLLTKAAVQVRDTGISVVGYILSGSSLVVLAWWWLLTYRRKSRGRHAR